MNESIITTERHTEQDKRRDKGGYRQTDNQTSSALAADTLFRSSKLVCVGPLIDETTERRTDSNRSEMNSLLDSEQRTQRQEDTKLDEGYSTDANKLKGNG